MMYEEINNLLLSDNRDDNMLGIIMMGKLCPHNLKVKFKYGKNHVFYEDRVPVYIVDVLKTQKAWTVSRYLYYAKLIREYESSYKGFDKQPE